MKVGPVIDAGANTRIRKYITDAEAAGTQVLLDGRVWTGPAGCEVRGGQEEGERW